MVSRRQRKQSQKSKYTAIASIAILVIGLALSLYGYYAEMAAPVSTGAANGRYFEFSLFWPKWRDVIFAGVPLLRSTVDKEAAVKVTPLVDSQQILRKAVLFLTNVDIKDRRSLMRAEIPILAIVKQTMPTISAASLPNFPKFDPKSVLSANKPLVGIYHTHTAESFVPSSGVSHRPGGQRGDIVQVGEAMAKRFEKNGVRALHSNTVHDFPSFMKAYGPSEITAKKMLADNPTIQMIFDIHRDADKRENSLATINGMAAARVTIVVAKGQPDLAQPYWQQNHAFAKLIDAKLNQHYPGLSRGIQVVEWRYNQHLHPRALLFEIGCQENSKEEAMRSAEMLADVLTEILSENQN
ncbi:MAG: stage II sporulation protein P [Negativicutes bacterium]|nr:stage II sporulation protein P [Negativicutes bacterium]